MRWYTVVGNIRRKKRDFVYSTNLKNENSKIIYPLIGMFGAGTHLTIIDLYN